MANSLLLLLLFLPFSPSLSAPISVEFLFPNSTFTPFHFVESEGTFLTSRNSTFSASFHNPGAQQTDYYLTLFHSPSNSPIWSANPNSPVPFSSSLSLSSSSLSLLFPNGSVAWSTPSFSSPVHSLRLLDSGNLVLLSAKKATLWQSFDHPTDTLVPNQKFLVGSSLFSSKSDSDLSSGDYRFFLSSGDAALLWKGSQQYWSLSQDISSIKERNSEVAYMALNATGLFLFDSAGKIAFRVVLPVNNGFRVAKLDSDGRFRVARYVEAKMVTEFAAPSSDCDLPLNCGSLGLCATSSSNGSTCSCPGLFSASATGACLPSDGSVLASLPNCGDSSSSSSISYLNLGDQVGYFSTKFSNPINGDHGFSLSSCEALCSKNCSCLAFFYKNSTPKSCFLLNNQLGSLYKIQNGNTDSPSNPIGFIKTRKSSTPISNSDQNSSSSTNVLPVLLPSIATILLVIVLSFVGFQLWRKRSKKNRRFNTPMEEIKLGRGNNQWAAAVAGGGGDDESDEAYWIPGLPTRFTYAELAAATNDFRILIGSGGFGSVYKGELTDKTVVAVKKMTDVGMQGKREFCTEIAVIGKIHHVNLVKLRGFCAQERDRLLVYEYMNRGSLDRSLFGPGPVLEWQERMDIAVGAARGLAYLHSGCDHKIIHCDIKPENILLADHGHVKISDFGMAKLVSPEQSAIFTTMRGTRGYLAPEWLTNSAISDKTDVYSYGMVLLELLRGRKNRSHRSGSISGTSGGVGEFYFPMVAVEMHAEGRWLELADKRMEGRVDAKEVENVAKVALCCLHEEPTLRPSMAAVVGMLEGTAAVQEPKSEALRFLRLYGRGVGDAASELGVVGGNYAGSSTSTATGETSGSSMTYISSQQVSGPR